MNYLLNEIQSLQAEIKEKNDTTFRKTLDYWFITQKIKTLERLLKEQNGEKKLFVS